MRGSNPIKIKLKKSLTTRQGTAGTAKSLPTQPKYVRRLSRRRSFEPVRRQPRKRDFESDDTSLEDGLFPTPHNIATTADEPVRDRDKTDIPIEVKALSASGERALR